MRFEFATSSRVVFGPGTLVELGGLVVGMGRRTLVVTGRTPERAGPLFEILKEQGMDYVVFPVEGEPTIETVRKGTQLAREAGCDMVVGFGGGSALDAGKAVAALLTNGGDPLDYLEVVGRGRPLTRPSTPYVAVPTTAGTGSEVTRNAVLLSPEHRVKVSLRSHLMLPRLALVDPELTCTLPPEVTASTGMDALTQLIEAYVSNRANPMTDGICREGMRRAARSLLRAYERGDPEAREEMSLASLFGGMALTNAKLGAVHGFAGPIGGEFRAPHGAVCAALLPHVMEVNVRALRERAPESWALRRYDEVGRILTGKEDAGAEEGVAWVRKLCEALRIPPLASYGIGPEHFGTLVERASTSSSMQGNPIKLTQEEMEEVLARAVSCKSILQRR